MIKLQAAARSQADCALAIIDEAKAFLKRQGIDQWQSGYPDRERIEKDLNQKKGFFVVDEGKILGYLCIDFDGEPAYADLNGTWQNKGCYVVVHRMAFAENARGKKISDTVFRLVEVLSRKKGIGSFRIDTDAANQAMQHILKKNGFVRRRTVRFDKSEKIAFEKTIEK